MKFDINRIENLGIEKIVHRGTADIIERDDEGIFIRDQICGAYMVSCLNLEKGKAWIDRYENLPRGALVVTGRNLAEYAISKFDFETILECHQFAYMKKEAPESGNKLRMRTATLDDLGFIMKHYDLVEEEELRNDINRGAILMGEYEDVIIGFVGEHAEGSIGLLFVLPEYRQMGFAIELEVAKIRSMLADGYIPFGQVVVGNEKSLRLQNKLGFTESDEHVYWLIK